jgi:uncharacterized protein
LTDLLTALGLVLVIEGAIWALFPHLILRAAEAVKRLAPTTARIGGAVAAALGLVIVWALRG